MIQNIIRLTISGVLLFFLNVNITSACSCKAQPDLSVMNLNDSEFVFRATLEEYSLGMAAGSLKFKIKQIFKGDINETITIYFKLKDSHTLFSKSVKFKEQKDWVVFARKKVVGNREYYRLVGSENSSFCALSRPIIEKSIADNYLEYLSEMGNQADGFKQIFLENKKLTAEGNYKNNQPNQLWKYYKNDGQIYISGYYKEGKRDGEWQKYTLNSKDEPIVIQKRYYARGELIEIHDLKYSGAITFKKFLSDTSEIRHYLYEDGSINSITNHNKDEDTMDTESYYKNGVIREKKYFIGEKLMYKYQFDESGQKVNEWTRQD